MNSYRVQNLYSTWKHNCKKLLDFNDKFIKRLSELPTNSNVILLMSENFSSGWDEKPKQTLNFKQTIIFLKHAQIYSCLATDRGTETDGLCLLEYNKVNSIYCKLECRRNKNNMNS